MHYPVAEASLKKIIHDCFVEQDNSPPLKFRQPFPSTRCVCRDSLSIRFALCDQIWCSCTFKGNLGHPPGTVSCQKVLGEQTCAPPWPGVAAAGGAAVSGCYDQERRNPRQINSLRTQVTASGSSQTSGRTPKTRALASAQPVACCN